MKTMKYYLLAAMLCTFSSALAHNTLTPDEKKEGWKLLFDGNSLAHWRSFKNPTLSPKWIVKDGVMVKLRGGGDIVTKAVYENFDLKLDWKIAKGGNSGIFILVNETPADKNIYTRSPEIQILDNVNHPDSKLRTHTSGSLYDMIAAPALSQKPAGEWNSLRIRMSNRHLQVWQNGIPTADIKLGSKTWEKLLAASKFKNWAGFGQALKGGIGIQEHGSKVSLRNIKIKKLAAQAAGKSEKKTSTDTK